MGCGAATSKGATAAPVASPEEPEKTPPRPPPKVKHVTTPCDTCNGTGTIPGLGKCDFCQGKGTIVHEVQQATSAAQPELARNMTEAPTYACLLCPAVFSRESALKQHTDRVHDADAVHEAHYPRYWVHGDARAPSWVLAVRENAAQREEEAANYSPPALERSTSEDTAETNEPDNEGAERRPCRYGATCFRKNPAHRARFSHPGDDDYTAPADQDAATEPSNKPSEPAKCSICGQMLKSQKCLERHMKAKHPETNAKIEGCVCGGFGVCPACQEAGGIAAGAAGDAADESFDQMFLVESSMLQGFRELAQATYLERCTRDRPCPNCPPCGKPMEGGCECVNVNCKGSFQKPGLPIGYQVAKVIRVEDSGMWDRYASLRAQIVQQRQSEAGEPLQRIAALSSAEASRHPGLFAPLSDTVNEVYLFHGTSFRSSLQIAQEDIRMELAGSKTGQGLGAGFYCAESITKADEYARDEPGGHYDSIFAVVLFRVCLGKVYVTAEFDDEECGRHAYDQVANGQFDSVIGDRSEGTGTFREFVIYNKDQAYPEYVILYERVYKDPTFGQTPQGLHGFTLQVPVYWINCHQDPAHAKFREEYPVRKLTGPVLQRLLQGAVGKSSRGEVTLCSAVRVEDSFMWTAYAEKKKELTSKWRLAEGERCLPPHRLGAGGDDRVLTTAVLQESEAEAAISLENLSVRLNEFLLFHGTSKEAAYAIAHTGFRIDRAATSTRFGIGAYFAEDVGKSLSYATEIEGKRYLLLCRVVCGQLYFTENAHEPSATAAATAAGKDGTLANPEKKGPREFIVFEEAQVYPEYILEVTWKE